MGLICYCLRKYLMDGEAEPRHLTMRLINPMYFTWSMFKKFTLVITITASMLHMVISCDKIYLLVSKYLSLWSSPALELAIIGGICVLRTHLDFVCFLFVFLKSQDQSENFQDSMVQDGNSKIMLQVSI